MLSPPSGCAVRLPPAAFCDGRAGTLRDEWAEGAASPLMPLLLSRAERNFEKIFKKSKYRPVQTVLWSVECDMCSGILFDLRCA